MGKASTNKKVARAAGISGGRTHRRNTPWTYFGIIAVIVVLGVAGTVQSRNARLHSISQAGDTAPTVGTTWNEGYAVYECGKFVNPISVTAKDPEGITTRYPGVILIAPKVKDAAGKNATLGKFSSATGMKLNAAELQVPGSKLYQDGDSCEGHPGHVYVRQFVSDSSSTGQLYNGDTKHGQLARLDPRNVPLTDKLFLTIAFVPADDASAIPAPPASVATNLAKAEAAATSSSSTTTVPSSKTTSTTVAKQSSTTSTTTAKG